MRTTVPDESGWYWVKMIRPKVTYWRMAHVDTDQEQVMFWDGLHPANAFGSPRSLDTLTCDLEERIIRCEWYGPFHCPGGPFGSPTIVMDEETHQQAADEHKAICITYVDYQHCADEKHNCSITSRTLRSRQDADMLCYRDATQCDSYVGDHSIAKTETLPEFP